MSERKESITVKEIVIKWLKEHKYDGLYCEDCACDMYDICLLDCDFSRCQPGVWHKPPTPDGENLHWIGPKKSIPPIPIALKSKICKACGKMKPFEEFPKHKECRDGRQGTCHQCKREQYKLHFAKTLRDEQKAKNKTPTHPHACDKCEKRFRTLYGLQEHKRIKHGAPDAKLKERI